MYEVTIRGWFAAAHQLRLTDGSLEPLHGHNWQVAVTWAGPKLDAMEVLVDFTALRPRLDALLAQMHDRNLNDLPPFRAWNPSAERVAEHVASHMAADLPAGVRLARVEVEEAPGCMAAFIPDQAP
jgi:6-pyruvoyltetrahydropterin/6-carboxytetrahydropterin synthase